MTIPFVSHTPESQPPRTEAAAVTTTEGLAAEGPEADDAQGVGDGNGASEALVRRRLHPARLAVQVAGSLIGLGLFAWLIRRAWLGGQIDEALANAAAWQLIVLVGSTIVSLFANGAMFWMLYEPVRRESERRERTHSPGGRTQANPPPVEALPLDKHLPHLSFAALFHLNTAVSFLNYAPIRLGLIIRLLYHRKVDGLGLSTLFAWMAAYGVLYMGMIGAVLVATVLRPSFDGWWFVLLGGMLTLGAVLLMFGVPHRLISSRMRGADRFFSHPAGVIGSIVLRLIDTVAYGGRLYVAFLILGIELSLREAVLLTLASMLSAMVLPVANLGFRDVVVMWLASQITEPTLTELTSEGLANLVASAAIIDRAGEAVVFIPFGVVSCLWLWLRWRRGRAPRRHAAARP